MAKAATTREGSGKGARASAGPGLGTGGAGGWLQGVEVAYRGVDAGKFAAGVEVGWPDIAGPMAGKGRVSGAALIGLADDLGVRLNNGRAGAAAGPGAIRAALRTYGVREPMGWDWPRVCDVGDVRAAEGADEAALLGTHARVSAVVEQVVARGWLPIGLGGGHDLTLGLVRPVAAAHAGLAGVYVDAHLDVRERAGSGMAFRRLVEDCGVSELRLLGFSAMVNAREHVTWFQRHGGRFAAGPDTMEHDAVKEWAEALIPSRACFVSVDLDGIDSGDAPGVSALNPAGLSAKVVAAVARAAGASKHVRCFDIMELNPSRDVDGRTARVAAHVLLSFLRGLAERGR